MMCAEVILTTNSYFFVQKNILKNLRNVNDLIKENGKFKTWENITHEFKIDNNLYFKWIQLVHTIPNHRKKKLTESTINSQNLSYLNHDLKKKQSNIFF